MQEQTQVAVRLDKETVVALVTYVLPQYLEILDDCRDRETWHAFAQRIGEGIKRLKIENYVHLYEEEKHIFGAFFMALMSKEEQAEFAAEINSASPEEQQGMFREMVQSGSEWDQLSDKLFPDDPELIRQQREAFEKLEGEERAEAIRHGQYLMGFAMAWLHNVLAVMVFGERMTSLVPRALAGDKEAFARAVQIDKNLLHEHPGFREIHRKATIENDADFLGKVAYRLAAPVTRGPIRQYGVFMLFALLETLGWLDDLKHREILDICDAAHLDRWQNRIEDENAVTKAIGRYRHYQKTGGVSMH